MESDYHDKGGNLYICYTIRSYIIMHHALYTLPLPADRFIRYIISAYYLTHKSHMEAVCKTTKTIM